MKTTKPGDATHFPKKGQTCRVHYEAFLNSDGSKFDSSRERGMPFEFVLGSGHVIPGWEKAVPKMSLVSGRARCLCRSSEPFLPLTTHVLPLFFNKGFFFSIFFFFFPADIVDDPFAESNSSHRRPSRISHGKRGYRPLAPKRDAAV